MLNRRNRSNQYKNTLAMALEQALREIARSIPDLHWATIASADGLLQTTYDPFGKERHDRISALTSAVLTLGERVFQKLQHGQLTYLTLAGGEGMLVMHPIGKKYMLAISTPTETEVATAIDTLAQVMPTLTSALYPNAS